MTEDFCKPTHSYHRLWRQTDVLKRRGREKLPREKKKKKTVAQYKKNSKKAAALPFSLAKKSGH